MEIRCIGNELKNIEDALSNIENKISSAASSFTIRDFYSFLKEKINLLEFKEDTEINNPVNRFYENCDLYGLNNIEEKLINDYLNKNESGTVEDADDLDDFSKYILNNTSNKDTFLEINPLINTLCLEKDVDANLIKSMIKVESNYNPSATSNCGAMGLMQLMPNTAKSLGVNNAYDISQNLNGGITLMKTLLNSFNGNIKLALAAYNAGYKRVSDFGDVPPIEETQNYVKNILALYDSGIA